MLVRPARVPQVGWNGLVDAWRKPLGKLLVRDPIHPNNLKAVRVPISRTGVAANRLEVNKYDSACSSTSTFSVASLSSMPTVVFMELLGRDASPGFRKTSPTGEIGASESTSYLCRKEITAGNRSRLLFAYYATIGLPRLGQDSRC